MSPDLERFRRRSCETKRRYPTEAAALAFAAVLGPGRDGRPLRVYPCRFCAGHHLTSATAERCAEISTWVEARLEQRGDKP